MGQKLNRPSTHLTESSFSGRWHLDDESSEVFSRAKALGIPVSKNDDPSMIKRLISAHNAGICSGRSISKMGRIKRSTTEDIHPLERAQKLAMRSPSVVLRTLRMMPGKMGCDIGGTCAKVVHMMSTEEDQESVELPLNFGTTGRTMASLEKTLHLRSGVYVLKFITGETSYLEKLIRDLAEKPAFQDLPPREVTVAGGGAHKYAQLFKDALNFDFKKCPEMLSVVEGLRFLLQHRKDFHDEVFQLNAMDEIEVVNGNINAERFLMVNIGSGVSILEVTADSFRRVGGSACGGVTFLGLARLMCDAKTFEEALKMAESGSGKDINKYVSDIYGKDGSASLGLSGSLTASNFGKMGGEALSDWNTPAKPDICRALLEMVIQGTCVLAAAFSSSLGISTIFFTGGFLRDNKIAMELLSRSMKNLKARAYFCRHCDFLGALGSLKICISDQLDFVDSDDDSMKDSLDSENESCGA